jgi:hypothetical protein
MKPKQLGEVSLTVVFLASSFVMFSRHQPAALSRAVKPEAVKSVAVTPEVVKPEAVESCCHATAQPAELAHLTLSPLHTKERQDPGREQEEEGNPSHTRPKHACNHKPAANQVQCHCATDCRGNGTPSEDRRCKSFCFKDMCSCPRQPCP